MLTERDDALIFRPPLSRSRIRQVAVNVKDLGRATRFYRDTLGLPFLLEAPGLAFFQCGEVVARRRAPARAGARYRSIWQIAGTRL